MKPEKVTPKNFRPNIVIYDDGDFAVAYGIWEDGGSRFAMRWNGTGDDPGYPKLFNNPVWFQLPSHGLWTSAMMQAIDTINGSMNQRIADLDSKLASKQ